MRHLLVLFVVLASGCVSIPDPPEGPICALYMDADPAKWSWICRDFKNPDDDTKKTICPIADTKKCFGAVVGVPIDTYKKINSWWDDIRKMAEQRCQ